jgi:hypothetical protein
LRNVDVIELPWAVAEIDDVVNNGTLSEATFDTDLEDAIGSGELGAGNAVIFIADEGDLIENPFLIVDVNGTAGYQAGEDLVLELESGVNLNNLSADNFI